MASPKRAKAAIISGRKRCSERRSSNFPPADAFAISYGTNGLSYNLVIGIGHQLREHRAEIVRQYSHQARRLGASPRTLGTGLRNHGGQQLTGSLHVLCLPRARQEGCDGRTDGKIRKIAQLLNSFQGVNVCEVREVEQRLRAYVQAAVVE